IKNGSTPRLIGMATVGLPADTIAEGSVRDGQVVADAIKEAVAKAGIEGVEAVIAVCGRELIIKKVQIPEVPAKDVHDVVMLEAEHDIPFGGNNYTQAISQRLNISFQQAEDAKLGKDVGVKWETLVPPLEAISRELSLEVQRTFDYFASTAESERIGKIVLAGGCAQLPGLNEYLASNWGIPVELARPFERIEVAPAYAEEAAAMAPALAVAVGLGLRRSGDKEQ